MIDYYETKAHPITRKMVLEAYRKVRTNGKAAGVDGVSLETFRTNLKGNLYKIWNRMSSGSYYPNSTREKKIEKADGKMRSLNIPCIEDKIAQEVVRAYLEPLAEPSFHEDSYGYRPKRHAHQAINQAVKRCMKYSWVLDMDIKSFFDTIDHELMLKAVKQYTQEKWVLMYIERWLKGGILQEDGEIIKREEGSAQGSVVSPLISNIFMHFVFDKWMEKHYPTIPFERYCDDVIVHCKSKFQTEYIMSKIKERLAACKLELSREKTQIVLCKNGYNRKEHYEKVSFTFLGFTFKPVHLPTKIGLILMTLPGISQRNKTRISEALAAIKIHSRPGNIQALAKLLNPHLRGWINYYCAFDKREIRGLWAELNRKLMKWIKDRKGWGLRRAYKWLKSVYKIQPSLFAHWAVVQP